MRATMLGLIASLTLALASPPTLAQPYPNPGLFRASWVNLNSVVTALQNYFADFGGYPQSAVELIGIGGRQYIAELPADPYTGAIFGAPPGYTYSPMGNPAVTYIVRTNWAAGGYGAECWAATPNGNIQYSPARGLQLTP